VGALTLKSFPFELRGWDIENFEGFDPTDSFGSNTRVYVSKDQVVQIEPDYNPNTHNTWLTDKGRQFFDGIFGTWSRTEKNVSPNHDTKALSNLINDLIQTLYIYDHCNQQKSKNHFLTIVFENLSIEILSFLVIMSQNYSFIKLRRAENTRLNNDLESNFQLNLGYSKLKTSTLCLLVSTNPRYEGYYLNLNLRQRFLKGNFKCFTLGSFLDLTFPTVFLGSNLKVLTTIAEGNHLTCQDIKVANNPFIVLNNEVFKRSNSQTVVEMLETLKNAQNVNRVWKGLNILSSSLSETGIHSLAKFLPVTLNDLTNFSSLYFLNVPAENSVNLKKITEFKLLNYANKISPTPKSLIDQGFSANNNLMFYNKFSSKYSSYHHLPSTMFYENEETFLTTDGFIKRTNKLIFQKKSKNNWQLLRKVFKQLKNTANISLDRKNSELVFFNSKKISNFKNFIFFQYQATQLFTNLNFYLSVKTQPFVLNHKIPVFKQKTNKIVNTKLKYWLDDFFSGGKDEYSRNSLVLSNCSKILRSGSTNFF
jgi:NADH dehydrogenase/NADH:ubiquinone oxidoreductase subunit G